MSHKLAVAELALLSFLVLIFIIHIFQAKLSLCFRKQSQLSFLIIVLFSAGYF